MSWLIFHETMLSFTWQTKNATKYACLIFCLLTSDCSDPACIVLILLPFFNWLHELDIPAIITYFIQNTLSSRSCYNRCKAKDSSSAKLLKMLSGLLNTKQ